MCCLFAHLAPLSTRAPSPTQNLVVFCHFGLRKDDAFCRAIAKHCLKLQELVLELDGPLDAATLAALVQLPRLRTLQLQGAVCDDALSTSGGGWRQPGLSGLFSSAAISAACGSCRKFVIGPTPLEVHRGRESRLSPQKIGSARADV